MSAPEDPLITARRGLAFGTNIRMEDGQPGPLTADAVIAAALVAIAGDLRKLTAGPCCGNCERLYGHAPDCPQRPATVSDLSDLRSDLTPDDWWES